MATITQEVRLCQATVRAWLKRFNRQGLAGLQEAPRPGRPATYTPAQVSEVIATSLGSDVHVMLALHGSFQQVIVTDEHLVVLHK